MNLEISSLCATCQIFLGIHSFKPTQTCLIIKVLATQPQFLELFGYCTVINCTFIFHKTNVFSCFHGVMALLELNNFTCSSVWLSNYTAWSNAQHVSTPVTTIQLTTTSTFHGLNCFSHIIYVLQTSTYQNIVKLFKSLVHKCCGPRKGH